ncbi:MAG: hypothetical protein LBS45_08055 [Synergistaceae bacterium]|nr:hypothetical protein [Synergistaceae bacterium]
MIKVRKRFLLFAAIAAIIAISGAAWAGITAGVLNSDTVDVDLSESTHYIPKEGLTLGIKIVYLTQNLTLGDYAQQSLNIATKNDAGGAIFVDEGQTLNITPVPGKSVMSKGSSKSSLRLFGGGTTNLSGNSNSYTYTFLQSGRLNVASPGALGGSEVTLAGGSVFGIMDGGTLDLSGVTLKMTRYDPDGKTADSVTFDTGTNPSNIIKVNRLQETDKYTTGTAKDIKLIKNGLGTLDISGVTDNTGGMLVNTGTLELDAAPVYTQTIEVSADATLASNVNLLTNITLKPHSGATVRVPAVRAEASVTSYGTGTAALSLAEINKTEIQSSPFIITANLDGLYRPTDADEDQYYVKLLNIPSHGLAARDVTVEAKVPDSFSQYYYDVETFVDSDNIYARLTKDETAYTNVLDVTVFESSQQSEIINVVVAGKAGSKPFASAVGFKYSFIDSSSSANDPLRNAIFAAEGVKYNASRTKASFQIDLNKLKDENGAAYALVPGRSYKIAIYGTGDADGSAGLSASQTDSDGVVNQPDSGSYRVHFEDVIVDLSAGTIKPIARVSRSDGSYSTDTTLIYFNLCDAFGDPVKISGMKPDRLTYTISGRAEATFEKVPAGHYFVKVSSPEFATVKYSEEIVIPGSGGGGGGCDTGAGLYAFAAVYSAFAIKSLLRKKR